MFQKSVEIVRVSLNLTRIAGTLHGNRCTLLIISRSVLLRIKNISDKLCNETRNKYYIQYSLLTPRCRVLLEKLTGLQLVKKFPPFHGTLSFITALTSVRHLSLSWASPIQSSRCMLRDASPRHTPTRRSEWGSIPPDCFVSRGIIPHVSVS